MVHYFKNKMKGYMYMLKFQKQGSCLCSISFILIVFCSTFSSVVFAGAPAWQGPYIGAYVGGGFANNHASTNVGTVTGTSYFATSADINAVNNSGTSTNNPGS